MLSSSYIKLIRHDIVAKDSGNTATRTRRQVFGVRPHAQTKHRKHAPTKHAPTKHAPTKHAPTKHAAVLAIVVSALRHAMVHTHNANFVLPVSVEESGLRSHSNSPPFVSIVPF
jgi:hypothetical protein